MIEPCIVGLSLWISILVHHIAYFLSKGKEVFSFPFFLCTYMLKIFLDNEWCDYNYNELYYKKGYTNTPSTPLLIYDSSFNEVEGWSNSGYVWIEQDHQWYNIGTEPYFVYQNRSISLYRIDTRYSFPVYKKEGQTFLLQDSSFITPSSLHDSQGYTYTPSEPYAEKDGVVWAWYNPSENLYWDDNRKTWTPTPPVYGEPICGSMGVDYSESVLGTPIVRMERGGIGFTGILRENIIPSSGVVEVDSDGSFSIDLGLKTDVNYNWQTVYFGNNDFWYSGILNQEDRDLLESMNLRNVGTSSTGQFGLVAWNDAYTYEVTDLFTDVVDGHGSGSVPFDASNFHCESYNVTAYQSLIIRSILAFSTGVKAWRCKITPPSQFDVWIESVDSSNNVVIALRSVFTGLTATRANTIVSNAPTYLSRYNSYLNNQGGPYTMEDAISMRDNLQSKIPSGDTSTFGIRPAST